MPVITSLKNLNFRPDEVQPMPWPTEIFMVRPSHFAIEYVINPHMEGNIGSVDKARAMGEWETLVRIYKECGLNVHEIDGEVGLPDMVFCANQSLPYSGGKGKEVFMSKMAADQRKQEVKFIRKWYEQSGYEIHDLPDSVVEFEGMGDAIWHNGRRLLWGGHGYRSSLEAYEVISKQWEVPIVALELHDPAFYHLDTCFCVLDETHVLIYPKAFSENAVEAIHHFFPNVIEAPDYEARHLFACNATCPDGRNVIIQRGCAETNSKLEKAGFNVIEVDTQEFLKSGGSVFCMKMMAW